MKHALSRQKRWMFRLLAIGLGLALLAGLELTLRLTGIGREDLGTDPFVGFRGVQPLFVRSASGDRYEVPRLRQEYFRPESFAVQKAPREYRVFCLGGSTVQGRPYAIETAFSTWLELSLQAADPSRFWEVVNCGGVSYASYRLVPILQEVLQNYQPDLIVLYCGHNEFLEARSYPRDAALAPTLGPLHQALTQLQMYRAARTLVSKWVRAVPPHPAELQQEVDALLDYQGGLANYSRDDVWRNGVTAHYRLNLRRMAAMCRQAGVPLIICNPVVNLRDCPPFKYELDSALSPTQLQEVNRLWNDARAEQVAPEQQLKLLENACRIDPRHAGLRFHLGKCLEAAHRFQEAKRELIAAKDEDICPLRILEPMRETIWETAKEFDLPCADVEQAIAQRSPAHAGGHEWLIDHVHPKIEGHQLIADLILELMVQKSFVQLTDGWRERQAELYRQRFESLDESYFARGQQRLEGLKLWTQGRAKKIRGAPATPPDAEESVLTPPAYASPTREF